MPIRTVLSDFALKNPFYAGAVCSVFEVNQNLQKTTTLATVYAAPTGSTLRANPMVLDSEGKFPNNPLYVEKPVIIEVTPVAAAAEDLGVQGLVSRWRGVWQTATLYYPGERVRHPAGPTTYVVLSGHTSATFATDVSGGLLEEEIDGASIAGAAATIVQDGDLVVLKAGSTMSGNLRIAKSTPLMQLDTTGATVGALEFRRDNVLRWRWQQWTEADPTLFLTSYNNVGAAVGNVMSINNATRVVTFPVIPELPASNPTADNQAARKAYVDAGDRLVVIADAAITAVSEIEVTWTPGAYRTVRAMLMSYLPNAAEQTLLRVRRGASTWVAGASDYNNDLLSLEGGVSSSLSGSSASVPLSDTTHNTVANDHAFTVLDIDPGPGVANGEASIMWNTRFSRNGGPRRWVIGASAIQVAGETVSGLRFFWTSTGAFTAVGRILVTGIKA